MTRFDCPTLAMAMLLHWHGSLVSANGMQADQPPRSAANAAETEDVSPAPAPPASADDLVRAIVLRSLPPEYVNAKDWGKTKRRWNGLDVSLDGLQLKTKRRWKDVNHGTWTHYRAWLIDPERELRIHFDNLRSAPTQGAAIDLTIEARLGATGRLSEWNNGLQLYSFHADAEGRIRLQMTCELALHLDATHLPPDVLVTPRVTRATLQLLDFQLHRISNADGPLVHRLGRSLRDDIEREVNERQAKIVEKINRAITKQSDKLRFSTRELLASGWEKLLP